MASSFNYWISQGYDPNTALRLSKSKNQARLFRNQQAANAEAQQQVATRNAERERQQLQTQMQERQAELISAVRDSQPIIPKANKALKGATYQPAFSLRKKKKTGAGEQKATGAYQFASPLSMGIGLGSSSTTGIGLG